MQMRSILNAPFNQSFEMQAVWKKLMPMKLMGMATEEVHKRALGIIYGTLAGDYKYSIKHSWVSRQVLHLLEDHPFNMPGNDDLQEVTWVGSMGLSSSQGKFIEVVAQHMSEDLSQGWHFRVFGCPEGPTEYDIVVEAGDKYATYLVGGMTNYSGEGGQAYKNMLFVLAHWAHLLGTDGVEYYLVTKEQYEALQEEINQLEKELEEEHGTNG